MSISTIFADIANTPILHDPVEMGAWTAMIGLFATLGKMALTKIDRMIVLVIKTQEKQVQDQKEAANGLVVRHAEQLEQLSKAHRDQTERIAKEHAAGIERMAEAHASQVEVLTGVTIENKTAMTALLVQIDRYTREMREMRGVMTDVRDVIALCPGGSEAISRRDRRDARNHEKSPEKEPL
jgi:hypothetical protein